MFFFACCSVCSLSQHHFKLKNRMLTIIFEYVPPHPSACQILVDNVKKHSRIYRNKQLIISLPQTPPQTTMS